MKAKISLILTIILICAANMLAQAESRKGKNPVIVIPGIMGSKLVNERTGEVAWVRLTGAESDDLRLPISPNLAANRDDLIATDIVDRVKISRFLPGIAIYSELTDFLEKRAGYRRGNWDIPLSDDYEDTYYIFAYDWRRDNVENARLLLQKIEKLKAKFQKSDLRFDVIAHSMGGLITRYAAMYGATDLTENPKPNWAGTKHFAKIFMLGTPNEGSMNALDTLVQGYSIDTLAGKFFPGYLSREIAFTIPSIFELLPHGKAAKFYDETLKPLNLDIYDPKIWRKYGWTITTDPDFQRKNGTAKRAEAERYFEAVLRRTRLFHQALDAKTKVPTSISLYLYGSDCKKTLDGAIVRYDPNETVWKTVFDAESFRNISGEKVEAKAVRDKIFAKGDGTVSLSSLFADKISQANGQNLFFEGETPNNRLVTCEEHTSIPGNKNVHEKLGSAVLAAGK